jgi:hypothetical protein
VIVNFFLDPFVKLICFFNFIIQSKTVSSPLNIFLYFKFGPHSLDCYFLGYFVKLIFFFPFSFFTKWLVLNWVLSFSRYGNFDLTGQGFEKLTWVDIDYFFKGRCFFIDFLFQFHHSTIDFSIKKKVRLCFFFYFLSTRLTEFHCLSYEIASSLFFNSIIF